MLSSNNGASSFFASISISFSINSHGNDLDFVFSPV